MNFFGSPSAPASYFKAAFSAKFIFHEKFPKLQYTPHRSSYHPKNAISYQSSRKVNKMFCHAGKPSTKEFLRTQLLWCKSFSSLKHALPSTTKFKCMQIWSSIKKFCLSFGNIIWSKRFAGILSHSEFSQHFRKFVLIIHSEYSPKMQRLQLCRATKHASDKINFCSSFIY